MDTVIIFLIASQCQGNIPCIKFLSKCTDHIVKTWHPDQYPDPEDRARVAISICEKEYIIDGKWE